MTRLKKQFTVFFTKPNHQEKTLCRYISILSQLVQFVIGTICLKTQIYLHRFSKSPTNKKLQIELNNNSPHLGNRLYTKYKAI